MIGEEGDDFLNVTDGDGCDVACGGAGADSIASDIGDVVVLDDC